MLTWHFAGLSADLIILPLNILLTPCASASANSVAEPPRYIGRRSETNRTAVSASLFITDVTTSAMLPSSRTIGAFGIRIFSSPINSETFILFLHDGGAETNFATALVSLLRKHKRYSHYRFDFDRHVADHGGLISILLHRRLCAFDEYRRSR